MSDLHSHHCKLRHSHCDKLRVCTHVIREQQTRPGGLRWRGSKRAIFARKVFIEDHGKKGARQEHTGFLSPGQACPDHASGDQGLTMHKQGKASLQVMCRLVPVMRSWQRPHLRSACAQRRFPLVHICCLLSNSSHILQMQTSDFRCSLLALQCCMHGTQN